jgi:hypothetical protein
LWLDVAIVLLALLQNNPFGWFLHSSKILASSRDKNGGGYIPKQALEDEVCVCPSVMLALCTVHRQAIYITDSTRTGIFPEEV